MQKIQLFGDTSNTVPCHAFPVTASDDVVSVLKVSHDKDMSVRANAERSTAQALLSQPGSDGQTFQ